MSNRRQHPVQDKEEERNTCPDPALAEFGRRWAHAELRGDTEALDALLTEDFHGVGPRGFIVSRAQWLERYASGSLVHDSFDWQPQEVRRYADAAVANGVQSQQSVYEGRDMDGHFRVTQLLVRGVRGARGGDVEGTDGEPGVDRAEVGNGGGAVLNGGAGRDGGGGPWRLACIHLSPIAEPPSP